ncbi:hypothetical protein G6M89_09000 [Natronolimnobius sp. AArcel1]|uniref:hypothetical protein n=1 Tax=Natronolimnobius sp. AArcel1 TaxID=1679093 RepID=UPI0013EC40FC|nr:hypothetical protein [Natronolimnobius sp. AArcel1]NGM69143.1 hypothetical protein [Natronolimnobius sp. AArcel1]
MRVSGVVYKFMVAVSLTIAVLTVALLPFLEPGSSSWVIAIFTLGVTAISLAIAALGLYFRWDPFRPFEEV